MAARGKKSLRGEESSRETTAARGGSRTTKSPENWDIKIVKPLCLCKNVKFGPSNAKFAKIHKSNAKLLESNF